MKKRRIFRLTSVLALGLGLTLALLWLLGGEATPVTAAPASRPLQGPGDVYCVAPVSQTYAGCTRVFTSVQFAVDAAVGGEIIKVAAGTYTDVHQRIITQVVYINTPITIRGGYTTTNSFADPPDPETYPTTLDAGGQGRVIYITGVTATLEGLRLTNGSTSGNGGALLADSATTRSLVISGCQVYSNAATTNGGGIYIFDSYFPTLTGNKIYSNTAGTSGGGIYFSIQSYVALALTDNDVYSNTADRSGGGIWLIGGTNAVLANNDVYSNTLTGNTGFGGGGICLADSPTATLTGNHVYRNTAGSGGGGGISLAHNDSATLANNWVYSNTTRGNGGGIYLYDSLTSTLLSNRVYSNTADVRGGGLHLHGSDQATLENNDVYRNTAGSGGGGIGLVGSKDASLTGNQIYSNTTTTDGGGIFVTSNNPNAVLKDNDIHDNTANNNGGGIHTSHVSTCTMKHNQVYSNTALNSGGGLHCSVSDAMLLAANDIHHNAGGGGGGIVLYSSDDATLMGNRIYANTAITYNGGGLAADFSTGIRLVNNLVVDNRALTSDRYPGILIHRSEAHFFHTTVARNSGGSGVGLRVSSGMIHGTVALTNTILVSHAVGIEVGSSSTATLESTLWGDGEWANESPALVNGTIISSNNVIGDPSFVNPDGGDYHITGASAGRDVAVSTVVTDDIDGDSRPFGAGPDIGADEAQCHVRAGGTYYRSVQAAVDASTSPTDVVQVAGTCRGVETRGAPSSDQVAYISKTLTVRGGYSPDFSAWDPQVYPTTLDAQGQGRVVYLAGQVLGYITPTLEGLRLVNGYSGGGSGGGVNGWWASAIISGCHIHDSYAHQSGGGIYIMYGANARLTNNRIYSNTVGSSTYYGGGISLNNGDGAVFANNEVIGNQAPRGGGVAIYNSDLTMTNNVIAGNEASGIGSGLHILNCSPRLLHNTIARNADGEGSGIYVTNTSGKHSTVALTNTILVSHTVGITVTGGNTATLEATLWGEGGWANDLDWGGGGILISSTNVTDDPAFVNPDGGDYHINSTSAALDKGISTWVSTDIDGDPRAVGAAPDLGADEVVVILILNKQGPSLVNEGNPINYSLDVQNTGVITAYDIVLSDTLPCGAFFVSADQGGSESDGEVSWPPFDVAPGGQVTRTFTVTATESITNDDYMVSAQGVSGVKGTVVVTTCVNHSPAANAEAIPNTLHTGTVTLDGSGSSDPDGDALSYHWAQTGGPAAVSLAGAGAMTATFTAPLFDGVYTFTLTVSDTFGLTGSDAATVTITNDPPMADAGTPQTVTFGLVTLDGSGTHDDDGDPLDYLWQQTGGPRVISLNNADTVTATFTAPSFGGVYGFTLTVTDTFGVSDADDTTVTVNLPALNIAKSGPVEAQAEEPIVYTLTVTNSGTLAASSLVITDALPTGASFIAASDGGLLVGDVVSWTATSLGTMDRLTRTFTVTATDTITNSDYRASCGEGIGAVGTVSVVTEVSSERKIYLPLVLRGFQ